MPLVLCARRFVWKDERGRPDNRYLEVLGKIKRYYLLLNLALGKTYSLEGKDLEQPLNKSRAEDCMVLDSNYHVTNMPTLNLDADQACYSLKMDHGRIKTVLPINIVKGKDWQAATSQHGSPNLVVSTDHGDAGAMFKIPINNFNLSKQICLAAFFIRV